MTDDIVVHEIFTVIRCHNDKSVLVGVPVLERTYEAAECRIRISEIFIVSAPNIPDLGASKIQLSELARHLVR